MSEVKPALSADEWRHRRTKRKDSFEMWLAHTGEEVVLYPGEDGRRGVGVTGPEERHAVAALCMADQPFGFTRDDVADERWEIEMIESAIEAVGRTHSVRFQDLLARKRDRIKRIKAFLPPHPE